MERARARFSRHGGCAQSGLSSGRPLPNPIKIFKFTPTQTRSQPRSVLHLLSLRRRRQRGEDRTRAIFFAISLHTCLAPLCQADLCDLCDTSAVLLLLALPLICSVPLHPPAPKQGSREQASRCVPSIVVPPTGPTNFELAIILRVWARSRRTWCTRSTCVPARTTTTRAKNSGGSTMLIWMQFNHR